MENIVWTSSRGFWLTFIQFVFFFEKRATSKEHLKVDWAAIRHKKASGAIKLWVFLFLQQI